MPRSGAFSSSLSANDSSPAHFLYSAMLIATWINSMLWVLEIVQVIRVWKCVGSYTWSQNEY
jgi:hypothetical protein